MHPKVQTIHSVERLLTQIKINAYQRFVIVNSNADWEGDFKDLVLSNSEFVVVRKNEGYDFGTWKFAIDEILTGKKLNLKTLVLVNDSVYWFSSSVKLLDSVLSQKNTSDWTALTFSSEIKPHAQSFFQKFNVSVVRSRVFIKFWNRYLPHSSRIAAINSGEINFSSKLQGSGLSCEAYFDLISLQSFLSQNETLLVYELPICISVDTSVGSPILLMPELKDSIFYCFHHHNPIHHFAVILTKYFGFPAKIDLASHITSEGLNEMLSGTQVICDDEKDKLSRLFNTDF